MCTQTKTQNFNPVALKAVIFGTKNNNGAPFTVKSKATGKDFTFKISRTEFNGVFYTHVKVEVGYMEFRYLGTYKNGSIQRKGQAVETLAAKSIAFILRKVESGKVSELLNLVEFFHLGKCVRCGKTLTDAVSIEMGLGPVCINL